MKILLKIISFAGLALTIVPSILHFAGDISLSMHKTLMFIGVIAWFGTAPFWMNSSEESEA